MTKKLISMIVICNLVANTAPKLFAENLNLTTYYPSPSGVFKELRSTDKTLLSITTGDVGIGTASPTAKLDVRQAAAADIINVFDGATEVFTILDGGNVGIGSPNPINKLDIAGRSAVTGEFGVGTTAPSGDLHIYEADGTDTVVRIENTAAGKSPLIDFVNDAGDTRSVSLGLGGSSVARVAAKFFIYDDMFGDYAMVVDAGRVGIGTTSPANKLDVSGGNGSVGLILRADADNVGEADQPSITLSQDNGTVTGQLGYFGSTDKLVLKNVANDDLQLGANDTVHMTIRADGKVGMGTSSPASKLHIYIPNTAVGPATGLTVWNEANLASRTGLFAAAWGNTGTTHYGAMTRASGGSAVNYGIYADAFSGVVFPRGDLYGGYFNAAGGVTNYGVRGHLTDGSATTNYAGYFAAYNAPTNYGGYFHAANGATDYGIYVNAGAARVNCTYPWQDNGTYQATNSGGSCLDIAEVFESAEPLEPGDVVVWRSDTEKKLYRSRAAYEKNIAGIYSTSPGILMGNEDVNGKFGLELGNANTKRTIEKMGAEFLPLALAGRVPIKVTTENGAIKPGDYLTSSSTPGHAMKADKSGPVVAIAMESFGGEGDKGEKGKGKILVFVNPHYWISPKDLNLSNAVQGHDEELARLRQENENFKLRLDKLEQRMGRLDLDK